MKKQPNPGLPPRLRAPAFHIPIIAQHRGEALYLNLSPRGLLAPLRRFLPFPSAPLRLCVFYSSILQRKGVGVSSISQRDGIWTYLPLPPRLCVSYSYYFSTQRRGGAEDSRGTPGSPNARRMKEGRPASDRNAAAALVTESLKRGASSWYKVFPFPPFAYTDSFPGGNKHAR